MTRTDHILRALNANGEEFFYTGRAGEGWVSPNRSEAFAYSAQGASAKAMLFNKAFALHDLWFLAVEA